MSNIALVGAVEVEINNISVPTCTKIDARRSRPVTVKKGAFGPIGAAKGVASVAGSFSLAVPKTGLEIDLEALAASDEGFSITYVQGVERWALYGCQITDDSVSNSPEAGETDISVSFIAVEKVRLA